MRRLVFTILLSATLLSVNAQFRMVGNGAWSIVNDSTYSATVNFFTDLTGMSYLATNIADTMRVFTGTEQLYQITTVGATTFGSAEIVVEELNGDHGIPVGQVMVYDPDGKIAIPQNPFGNTGATAQIQAAIDSYNARLIGQSTGIVIDTTGLTYVESIALQGAIEDLDAAIGSAPTDIDTDQPILRLWYEGLTVPGGIDSLVLWMYFTAPTLSIGLNPTTTFYEVGTSNEIIISGSTTNPASATLSGGELNQTVPSTSLLESFGSATSYTDTITFTPQQGGSGQFNEFQYSFQASQDYSGTESGTVNSSTVTIYGGYPVFYGMSATDLSSTGDPYTILTKLTQAEGNKTVSLTGSGFIYYAIPKTWGDYDLSQIIDHNGFDVTPSFTAYDITVSSTGLTNDWSTVDYKLYKLNTTTTTSGYAYQFIR